MAPLQLSEDEKQVRLFIYKFVLGSERCPTLNEIAAEARLTPLATQQLLERLEAHSAIVLSPGSPNIWLADPFAALPTPYPVLAGGRRWFGMCVWDALGILTVADVDGRAPTTCPVSGQRLELRVHNGALTHSSGVVHFAVRAADWWEDIGFT